MRVKDTWRIVAGGCVCMYVCGCACPKARHVGLQSTGLGTVQRLVHVSTVFGFCWCHGLGA